MQQAVAADTDASVAHVRARLEVLEARVAARVSRVRSTRPPDAGRMPGVFLSDAEIDALLLQPATVGDDRWGAGERLLSDVEAAVDDAEHAGEPTRLRRLERQFGLHPLEAEMLVICLAPDLDARFERFYAYLHDDLSRRRASVGLTLDLAGVDPMAAEARTMLTAAGRLVGFGLVEVHDADRPFLSRTLRVPDRVANHLLGDDTPDPALNPWLVPTVPVASAVSDRIISALESGTRFFYAREHPGGSGSAAFGAALDALGLDVVELDLSMSAKGDGLASLVPTVLREVGLTGAGLVLDRADQLVGIDPIAFRRFAEAAAIVCLVGARQWDPDWARIVPFVIEATPPPLPSRAALWQAIVGPRAAELDAGGLTALSGLRMKPRQVALVAEFAQRKAAADGRSVDLADLEAGARLMNSVALDQLATRITPEATWSDLVLKPQVVASIRSVAERARHRELVQDAWGFGRGTRRKGTIALFSGPPGTGKTLAAEVIAGDLGVELYVVNLATVVDKYIGETEKNLEGVFTAAEEVNGLLFFDEADALFGKRSEVKDARDRYANIEVAYLLQRLERFDGVAVLATNLSANLDEAFARRLDVTAEFKLPELDERVAIWRASLPAAVPLDGDVDLGFLAATFELSGGSIRNICIGGAYLAAEETAALVSMRHLVRATALEHRKLGRLVVPSEFGAHYASAIDGLVP